MGTVPERAPDVGDAVCHPTAGATVVGARKFLIAYNVNLGTPDVAIARKIARTIRFSTGGFRFVKSMGVMLGTRNLAQVSINLTDFEQTPMHLVFETVRREAERYGVPVVGSEIVGLIPKKSIEMSAGYFLRFENFRPELVLENRVAEAIGARSGLPGFLDALAAPTATPGGGSAAAAADVLQVDAVGPPGGRFVEVHRHAQLVPDLIGDALGEAHALLERDALDGDERHHIGRSDARVRALMLGEVDQFDRLFDAADGCVGHCRRRSDERQNAAIVIGVRFAVEEYDIGHRQDGLHDRIHFGGIAPFGKIRDTLDKLSRHETTLCHTALAGGIRR